MSKSNTKRCLEQAFAKVLQDQLAENAAMAGVSIVTAQCSAKLVQPCVVVGCTSAEPLCGPGVEAYHGTLRVMICSSIDELGAPGDTASAIDDLHASRVEAVEEILDYTDEIKAIINDPTFPIAIGIYGYSAGAVTYGVAQNGQRTYSDYIDLLVDFEPRAALTS
jgi:hypothetical protein